MCQFGPSCKGSTSPLCDTPSDAGAPSTGLNRADSSSGSESGYSPRVEDDRRPVVVIPYDPDWPRRFEAERALLVDVLGPWLKGGIHHIGSTAIPGMAAKPIIDMMAGVRDLEEARTAVTPLELHSYHYAPHRPGTHHFFKPPGPWWIATHGLHLTEPGSDLWRERLAFRDALRADIALATEYADLKVRLAQEHGTEVERYTVGKRAFVGRVLGGVGLTLPPTSPR
jgi:GrpB-like predicted nucleotidyltransferase (UPF0157 family)